MSKRKREQQGGNDETDLPSPKRREVSDDGTISVQIIAGSYERSLHGITATIFPTQDGSSEPLSVQFADTFLFNAHASAVRCLALSPPSAPTATQPANVLLASGGTDERVNVYSLSATPVSQDEKVPMPNLGGNKIFENPRNRELGSLMHHSSSITSLYFPTRSKLLSAAGDNMISVSRTKDLNVVSSFKAPRPKAQGRPSGDTAPPGDAPIGINDFAVHPSLKLMITVGKGERCMRLWNLVTGKKAGVLNFGRATLQSVQEGKHSSGEGRKVAWNPTSEEFTIAFERGAVIFGEDAKPTHRILPTPRTKIHQMRYLTNPVAEGKEKTLLALSTEDGRILFYSADERGIKGDVNTKTATDSTIQEKTCVAELDGSKNDVKGRIKDFEVLALPQDPPTGNGLNLLAVTAGSEGRIRTWIIDAGTLLPTSDSAGDGEKRVPQTVGKLVGTYETGSRITCMQAFVMLPRNDHGDLSDFEGLTEDAASGSDSSD